MGKLTRRALLGAAGLAALGGAAGWRYNSRDRPAGGLLPKADPTDPAILNDASGLSPVRVAKHLALENDADATLLKLLRTELADARATRRPVMASAARHSMGAQSLPIDGVALTFDQQQIQLDAGSSTFRAASGMRWGSIISALDKRGYSPAVMQSNNDFGIASTFCVNAHGWPAPFGPFGTTVRSFRMMLASGDIVECSREKESKLFSATMGGYGLTGIILDLDAAMVPNARLEPHFERLSPSVFGKRMEETVAEPDVRMAYGRIDVSLGTFFEDMLLVSYRPAADQSDIPAAAGSGLLSKASRGIFRRQVGFEAVKRLRWKMETEMLPSLSGASTRNSLLNEPVATLDDGDDRRTDILHEYFVPPNKFSVFVDACREVIPSSYQELLNVTLRYVARDPDSVLVYAREPRIAAVMLFSQEMSVRAEEDMARVTRDLIDRVLALGGSYYLPYRPHATRAQFISAYPRYREFVFAKRTVDPDLLFRSPFWDRYLANSEAGA